MESRLNALEDQVSKFPRSAGVYVMRNEEGTVIYVGKAKSLRERVRTYLKGGDGRSQIQFLMRRVHSIEPVMTDTESQAFILERDLIRKYKPRYNIQLKDDKAYLSLRIDPNAPWPKIDLVRRVEQDNARYFGPYTFSYELRELLDIIQNVIPLRTCSNTVFYNRARPCLEYQIKRCAGPCCLPVEKEQYDEWVKEAIQLLEGKTQAVAVLLEERMEHASNELRFEDAALYRDRIEILKNFQKGQKYLSHRAEDRDVFALYRDHKLATLAVMNVRLGRIANNKNYSFSDVEIGDEEILEACISQYYQGGRDIPEEIVLPAPLENVDSIRDYLSEKRGRRVQIVVPERGVRKRLVNLALINAEQHYVSTFDEDARNGECAKVLAEKLGLKQVPRRIECIDISNLQGSDNVGALVAFQDGIPDKQGYRKYDIKTTKGQDDFASIHEVVTRRLRRGHEENDLPCLLIIDGGKGQLGKALEARDESGSSLEIVALAKERRRGKNDAVPERIFIAGSSEPIIFEAGKPVTHFIARIRDEVHRFVITFHRSKRSKRSRASVLDAIAGIGPERKNRLLRHFKSVERIRNSSVAEIQRVGRMSESLAVRVKEALGREH